MSDQADELRQLMRRQALRARGCDAPSPRMIVVGGGKGGVGTTTVAVNLAAALVLDGRRAVLVDADLEGADVATLCGVEGRTTIADVLAGRRDLHEALEPGPAGVPVLPGAWGAERPPDPAPEAQERLIQEIRRLGPYTEFVVLDVGNGVNRVTRRFWRAADAVLAVTTPAAVSVMGVYAAIKALTAPRPTQNVECLVNMAEDERAAEDVHGRVDRACRRFLGFGVQSAGSIPFEEGAATESGEPLVLSSPYGQAARRLTQLAERLAGEARERNDSPRRAISA